MGHLTLTVTGAAANTGRRARTHTRGHAVLIDEPLRAAATGEATPAIDLLDLTSSDWTTGGVGLGLWCAGAAPRPRGALAAASPAATPPSLFTIAGAGDRWRVPTTEARGMGSLVWWPTPAGLRAQLPSHVPHARTHMYTCHTYAWQKRPHAQSKQGTGTAFHACYLLSL